MTREITSRTDHAAPISHLRSLAAFVILVLGSLAFLAMTTVAAICLISFFKMFSGEAITYYWLSSLSIALPVWLIASYWLFRRILRALLSDSGSSDKDDPHESARVTVATPPRVDIDAV